MKKKDNENKVKGKNDEKQVPTSKWNDVEKDLKRDNASIKFEDSKKSTKPQSTQKRKDIQKTVKTKTSPLSFKTGNAGNASTSHEDNVISSTDEDALRSSQLVREQVTVVTDLERFIRVFGRVPKSVEHEIYKNMMNKTETSTPTDVSIQNTSSIQVIESEISVIKENTPPIEEEKIQEEFKTWLDDHSDDECDNLGQNLDDELEDELIDKLFNQI